MTHKINKHTGVSVDPLSGPSNNARRSEQMPELGSTGDTSNVRVSVGTGGEQVYLDPEVEKHLQKRNYRFLKEPELDSDVELPEPIQTLRSLVFDYTSDDIELRLRMVIADLRDGTAARERLPKDYYVEIIREIFEPHQPQQDLKLNVMGYRDEQSNEFTQVTAACSCGRGRWVRIAKHPDIEQVKLEARIEELGNVQLEHGRYVTQTFVNGQAMTVGERFAELTAQLNKLKDKEGKDE